MTAESKCSSDDEDDFKSSRPARRNFSHPGFFPKSLLARSIIRKINLHDLEEMQRISLIDKNPEVLKYMDSGPLDNQTLLNFVTDSQEKSFYVVAGSDLVPPGEKNKMQGWIMVYSGKEVTLRAVRALGKKALESRRPVLEISYAKYPQALPGQMANGLRLVLLKIAQKDHLDLLRLNSYYQRLVTAYTDSENLKSRHMLEATGFILQEKKILWDSKISRKKDLVYILNWQKLHQKLIKQEYG